MEISKDKKEEERIVYKSIDIAETLNPDKDIKKKSSIFFHIIKKDQYISMLFL